MNEQQNATLSKKPVVFLAFANDGVDKRRFLRKLKQEEEGIGTVLQRAVQNDLCEAVLEPDVTAQEIFESFSPPEYRNRIAIFHYAGHADNYESMLQGADGRGLADFLGRQRGMQLVFLNGCSTEPQVEQLLEAGVSAVISTSQAIDDGVAKEFAVLFYRSLGDGASIDTAFHEASAAVRTIRGNRTCGLYVLEVDGKPMPQAARAV